MYLLVLVLPFLNIIFLCVFGRLVGNYIFYFFQFNSFILFIISFFILYEVGICSSCCHINLWEWVHLGVLKLNWIILFDSITAVMLFLVTFISFLVHLYSIDYMRDDPHIIRFLGYLSLFTFFMLVLVSSGNFVQLFVGWEGVGLCSYLLINFWFTRTQANKSAIKAVLVNRFGDFGIYFALLIIFYCFRSFDFSVIFTVIHFLREFEWCFNTDLIYWICLYLFIGSVGKSAQLGLHTWLPDAMEGPTPVSALIHAATMVTAGVFVLIRCSPILEYNDNCLFLITLLGSLTAFFAGTLGLFQNDMKKVVAYSTCSQLGYMFLICGLSNYSVGLFHLFNHGFFKALLFLGAGSVIHAVSDEQDMRKMGGLIKILPITYCAILVGSLCLIGFPFLSGFYSKEMVLEVAFINTKFLGGKFFYWLGTFAAFLTSFYSLRLIYMVFVSITNSKPRIIIFSHESNSYIYYVISTLAFFSIFIGFLFEEIFLGLGSAFWDNSIFFSNFGLILQDQYLIYNFGVLESKFMDFKLKLIPLLFSVGGVLIAITFFFLYNLFLIFFLEKFSFFGYVYSFFSKKWYFDLIYNEVVYLYLNIFYLHFFKLIDRGFIEVIGPLSIVRILNFLSLKISNFQTGFIYSYIFIFMLSFIIILFSIFFLNLNNYSLIIIFFVSFLFLYLRNDSC